MLLFGAGFGSDEGLILSASIAQQNIFGSGRHLSLNFNTSKINTIYSLSYTNPYYTVDGVSQGFDLYYRNLDPAANDLAPVSRPRPWAGSCGSASRSPRSTSSSYGFGYDDTTITLFADSPLLYQNYVAIFGPQNTNMFVTAGWVRDGRDSLIYPTKGTLQKASAEVGTPLGDLEYYKLYYQYQRYFPLSRVLPAL